MVSILVDNFSKLLHRGPSLSLVIWDQKMPLKSESPLSGEFPSMRNNLILNTGEWVGVYSTFYERTVHRSL